MPDVPNATQTPPQSTTRKLVRTTPWYQTPIYQSYKEKKDMNVAEKTGQVTWMQLVSTLGFGAAAIFDAYHSFKETGIRVWNVVKTALWAVAIGAGIVVFKGPSNPLGDALVNNGVLNILEKTTEALKGNNNFLKIFEQGFKRDIQDAVEGIVVRLKEILEKDLLDVEFGYDSSADEIERVNFERAKKRLGIGDGDEAAEKLIKLVQNEQISLDLELDYFGTLPGIQQGYKARVLSRLFGVTGGNGNNGEASPEIGVIGEKVNHVLNPIGLTFHRVAYDPLRNRDREIHAAFLTTDTFIVVNRSKKQYYKIAALASFRSIDQLVTASNLLGDEIEIVRKQGNRDIDQLLASRNATAEQLSAANQTTLGAICRYIRRLGNIAQIGYCKVNEDGTPIGGESIITVGPGILSGSISGVAASRINSLIREFGGNLSEENTGIVLGGATIAGGTSGATPGAARARRGAGPHPQDEPLASGSDSARIEARVVPHPAALAEELSDSASMDKLSDVLRHLRFPQLLSDDKGTLRIRLILIKLFLDRENAEAGAEGVAKQTGIEKELFNQLDEDHKKFYSGLSKPWEKSLVDNIRGGNLLLAIGRTQMNPGNQDDYRFITRTLLPLLPRDKGIRFNAIEASLKEWYDISV